MVQSVSNREDRAQVCAYGSGGSAIAGYDYQIDVSVWLALDLILANKFTREIVLEPVSEEDLEAEIEDTAPERVTSTAWLDGYTLIVQAKLRTGDAWTVAGVNGLLRHGSVRRPSAAKRLAGGNVRYLLVTSAGLNGVTRGLKIRRAGVWPKPEDMPRSMRKCLPVGSAGRVAVIGNQDEERLSTDVKQLLTERFRVPHARWKACLNALRKEAHIRIRGGGSGRWKRDELECVIRENEGYIASSHELEHYVHPTNWGDLRAAIEERNAALIVGQSGTGKTMAARKLYEELREEIPGLARIAITDGPGQLFNDRTEAPVFYEIEDPWGRFDFERSSRAWNDQLATLFAHATHDRVIVATSRLDVAESSGAVESVSHWIVSLEAEHYGKRERHKLIQSQMERLPRHIQFVARQAEFKVLSALRTPLEIQKFVDALATSDGEHLNNPPGLIAESIRQAHQEVIERTVIEQIEARDDVRAAAVVWGLFKAIDKLSLREVLPIEAELADRDDAMIKGVTALIGFFVAARNFRQTENTISYYHPRVDAGIEQTLLRHYLIARSTLGLLVEVLTSAREWGTAAAARVLAATDKTPDLKPVPEAGSAARIDAWLEDQLMKGGEEFRSNLVLASAAGSTKSNASEVARYLLERPDRDFPGIFNWGRPDNDEGWYERVRGDSATKPLVEAFIRNILPSERANYGTSFATDVERLVPDLSDAFIDAAIGVVHFGHISTFHAIAEGALRRLDGFEAVVDAAVEVVSLFDDYRPEVVEEHLAIANREYSEDHAQVLIESDEGGTARDFLEVYVQRVRSTLGWRNIAEHRHRERLVWYWLRELANEETANVEEIEGAFVASYEGKHEDFLWFVLSTAWNRRYLGALATRVEEGHANREVRQAAISCLVKHGPAELAKTGRSIMAGGEVSKLIELAVDMAQLCNRPPHGGDLRETIASVASATLSETFVELVNAEVALEKGMSPVLAAESRRILEMAQGGGIDVRRFRVALDATVQLDIEDDIRWLLLNADEAEIAAKAIAAAIRRGMTKEVEDALDHKFADVSALALTALAEHMRAPLPDRILAKAEAKGSPIRKALVEVLDAKPHLAHLQTLVQLAEDTWTNMEFYYDNEVSFPIAQAAVDAIGKLAAVAPKYSEQLYEIANKTHDFDLRFSIFTLLARTGGREYQDRLFELALAPGRVVIRRLAASSLLEASEAIVPEVVARISAKILTGRAVPAAVAVQLTLLFALRAEIGAVRDAANVVAVDAKRRVLVLLLIRVLTERDFELAQILANLLPADHVGVAWALGGDIDTPNDALLADLGEPIVCGQVLLYMT